MKFHHWLRNALSQIRSSIRRKPARRPRPARLQAEELEPRCVPSLITVAAFNGVNGDAPTCTLIEDSSGNLFGTTSGFYTGTDGGVFEASPAGNNSFNIKLLAKFAGSNGDAPFAGLVEDKSGNLFGVASGQALGDNGNVFEVVQGSGQITSVAKLSGTSGTTAPLGDLVMDSSGNLFGTATGISPQTGNPGSDGAIFEVQKGSNSITTVASFSGDNGSTPYAGLIEDSAGNLFGATTGGGVAYSQPGTGYGTVYEVKKGTGTITTLATFDHTTDGSSPDGRLMEDSSGDLFGTTANGGTPASGMADSGTVFELPYNSSTQSYGAIITLATFNGTNGAYPLAGLIADSHGNLFGTTTHGGASDMGTAFEVPYSSSTQSYGAIITLATFGGLNGAYPWGGLVLDSSGPLFGTTSDVEPVSGTASGDGTIFEITPPAITTTTLPEWTANLAYNQTISTSGFNGTLTFTTSDTLPPGLTLSTSGVLSGTPTTAGAYTFTVTASDNFGETASKTYTVFLNPPVMFTTTSLPSGSVSTPYNLTLQAMGGTVFLKFSETGTLPAGIVLNNAGVLSGTPTAAGTFSFTVTATDKVGASASQQYTLTIMGGQAAKYLVAVQGSVPRQAGSGFLIAVQAADQNGNPVTSYSGPASATATLSPTSSASNFPATVAINSSGLGLFLANIPMAGTYTITVANSSFTGSTGPVTVMPGPAVKLAFGAQPVNTPTGVALPAVTAQVEDSSGNVVTGDNTDTVILFVASGPGSFAAPSPPTATVVNGVATFNNLILTVPGMYTLGAVVPTRYTGPNSSSFTVLPLQVMPGSFAGTPAGFSLQLNGPILVNSVTPALYGVGHGSSATVMPTVTLTQTTGTPPAGATLPYQVPGSVIVDNTTNRLTFVETDTTSIVNNNTPVLPDGTYVVDITSSGVNGLQAPGGGGYLDGTGAGTPGHDFTATFSMSAAESSEDVLWLPPTADGPGQALSGPGMNQVGGGYPVYLDDGSGKVTSIQATLDYNATLLTVTPTSSAKFTVTVPTPGTALLSYSGPALAAGLQTPIGFITAAVPAGTTANPMPYKAEDLLQLSSVSLNNNGIAASTVAGLHLVAYVGDADGNGMYSGADAVLITHVTLAADTGFAAYPLVDPTVVADTDGSGFVPSDAALQANEAGVGVPTATLANPPIPSGVHFKAIAQHVFMVSAADVHAGSPLARGAWSGVPTIHAAPRQIDIALSSPGAPRPITSTLPASLVTIEFHINPSSIDLVPSANSDGQPVATELEDAPFRIGLQRSYTPPFSSMRSNVR